MNMFDVSNAQYEANIIPAGQRPLRLARRLAGAAMLVAVLSGCTSPMLYTQNLGATNATTPLRGVPYYLPKTVLPFTLKGAFVDKRSDDAKKDKNGKAIPAKKTDLAFEFTLTLQPVAQVADGSAPMLLVYHPEAVSEDHFTLAVNAKGLLTTTKLESEDDSAKLITSIADIAGRVAGHVAGSGFPLTGMPSGAHPSKPVPVCQDFLKEFEYSGAFDLTAPAADVNHEIMAAMRNAGADIDFDRSKLVKLDISPLPAAVAVVTDGTTDRDRGVVFRAATPRNVTVSLTPAGIVFGNAACHIDQGLKSALLKDVQIADRARVFAVDTSRAYLVKKSITLTIEDGNLTGIEVTKPSELAALFALPASVVDTFSKAVFGGITGRTTMTQDQVSLLQQQLALIKAQQDLQAARAAQAGQALPAK